MKATVVGWRPLPTPDFSGFLDRLAGRLAEEMRERAPVRTGRLRDSIRVVRVGQVRLVGPTVPYALFVEFGTHPHIIRPHRARALRFEVEGRTVFAMYVRHPGFRGRFFIRRSVEAVMREIPDLFAREVFG